MWINTVQDMILKRFLLIFFLASFLDSEASHMLS